MRFTVERRESPFTIVRETFETLPTTNGMRPLKLHQIVEMNDSDVSTSFEISEIKKYKRSLLTIYGNNAVLMVTDVFNACSYGRISDICDFDEDIREYVENRTPLMNEEEAQNYRELIGFQSILLRDL